LLAALGYHVIASTGRRSESDYLTRLGAREIIDRAELSEPGRPLGKERWAGVIDSVGSHTLANACASTMLRGSVAACGLAQGMDLPATVAPFILRGVNLLGIDSVMCPMPLRMDVWRRLASDMKPKTLQSIAHEIPLAGLPDAFATLVAGGARGRFVVNVG
jgi:acrylyl-CoA reductase (NADPH)